MKEKTYKVIIYNYETGEESAVIGTGLTYDRAEQRILTGLSRCNSDYGTKKILEGER